MNPNSLASGAELLSAVSAQSVGNAAPPPTATVSALRTAVNEAGMNIEQLLGDLASGTSSGSQLNVYA
ncbi:MAG TPA: hypothetical protein VNK23_09625 [Candidatus Dormibacteraeota bacterium]|nr:hypothetical protein [Candidatus Dormibacteraeota bacterium]